MESVIEGGSTQGSNGQQIQDNVQRGSTPSLRKLLSLDETYEDFNTRLHVAAEITGISAELLASTFQFSGFSVIVHQFHGRAEWVLRWLLGKLKQKDQLGKEARANEISWILLNQLIRRVPVPVTARLSTENKILAIVELALEEAGSFEDLFKDCSGITQSLQSLTDDFLSESNGSQISSHLGKRKRDEDSINPTPASTAKKDYGAKHRCLFRAHEVLDFLLGLSRNDGQLLSANYADQVAAVLHTDSPQAARLLKLWLTFLTSLFYPRVVSEKSGFSVSAALLSPVLAIWDSSSTDIERDIDAIAGLFSAECLLPVAVLLAFLREPRLTKRTMYPQTVRDVIPVLEELLGKYLFLPARPHFSPTEVERHQPSDDQSHSLKVTLPRLLDPIRSRIGALLHSTSNDEEKTYARLLLLSLPSLFDVAIRCIPSASAKKRKAESPWLQHVFVALANSGGISIPSQDPRQLPDPCIMCLENMLSLVLRYHLALDAHILGSIIQGYAGIAQDEQGIVRWTLIAKVLNLDFDVFLPDNGRATSAKEDHQRASRQLSSELLDRLSKVREESKTPRDETAPASATPNGFLSNHINQLVTIPLMQSYAKGRDLASFLDEWKARLAAHISNACNDSMAVTSRSVWEDECLTSALSRLLESSLTSEEIFNTITAQVDDISHCLLGSNGADPETPVDAKPEAVLSDAFAAMIILDAVLLAVHSEQTFDRLREQVFPTMSIVVSLVVSPLKSKLDMSRIWRILTLLYMLSWRSGKAAAELAQGLLLRDSACIDSAMACLSQTLPEPSQNLKINIKSVSYEAFVFLLTFFQGAERFSQVWPRSGATADEAMRCMIDNFLPMNDTSLQREQYAERVDWDGCAQTIWSPERAALALSSAVVRLPAVLTYCSDTYRQRYFYGLLLSAAGSYHSTIPTDSSKITFSTLIDGCCDQVMASVPDQLRDDFIGNLLRGLDCSEKVQPQIAAKVITSAELQFLRIPISALSRKNREAVLDRMLQLIQSPPSVLEHTMLLRRLGLMVRLMKVPNATSRLSTEPQAMWDLAQVVDKEGIGPGGTTLAVLDELIGLNMKHVLATAEQPRSQQYLADVALQIQKTVSSKSSYIDAAGTLGVITSIFAVMRSIDSKQWPFDISGWIGDYLKTLKQDLEHFVQQLAPTSTSDEDYLIATVIEAVTAIPVEHLEASCPYFENMLEILLSLRNASAATSHEFSIHKLYTLLSQMRRRKKTVPEWAVVVELMQKTSTARSYYGLLDTFKEDVAILHQDKRVELSQALLNRLEESRDSELMRLFSVLLDCDSGKHADPTLPDQIIAFMFTQFCDYLPAAHDLATFHIAADCMEAMLRTQGKLKSQFAVDAALASLIRIASASGPGFPSECSDAVFTRLCHLMHQLVLLHQIQLRGRYHLVVQALQVLLGCLFVPDTRLARHVSMRPPWLTLPLQPEHARLWARLISSLCSPSVSAVTKRRKRSQPDLVDETRKARDYAGQFIRGVIEHFCKSQLSGRILPEVKEALMPGLYAGLEAMTPENMRAMNAAMDSSSRAIWKDLYEQWKRFGQFKER